MFPMWFPNFRNVGQKPFLPGRVRHGRHEEERHRHAPPQSNEAPRLAYVPRTAGIRRGMAKEAVLFRSPLRWALLFPTWFGGVATILTATRHGPAGSPFLALLATLVAWFASFGRNRILRAASCLVIIVAGAQIQMAGELPWSGTILLVAGIGLLGAAFGASDVVDVERRSRDWIRDHSHAPESGTVHARVRGRSRSETIEARRAANSPWLRSPVRWGLLLLAVVPAAVAVLATSFDPFTAVHFAGTVAIPASATAAFARVRWVRVAAAAAAVSAGVVLVATGSTVAAGVPVVAAGVALAFLPAPRLPPPREP